MQSDNKEVMKTANRKRFCTEYLVSRRRIFRVLIRFQFVISDTTHRPWMETRYYYVLVLSAVVVIVPHGAVEGTQ